MSSLSLCTAEHVVTKRNKWVCEGDYYVYTKKWKSTVIVRSLWVIHQSNGTTERIAYQDFKKISRFGKKSGECESEHLKIVSVGAVGDKGTSSLVELYSHLKYAIVKIGCSV